MEVIQSIEVLDVLIFIGLLFLSAFFSGSETAITAVNEITLGFSETDQSRTKKNTLWICRNKETVIAAILVGNNIVNTVLAVFAGSIFNKIFVESKILSPAVGTVLSSVVAIISLLIFGEVVPKQIGCRYAKPFAKFVSFPIYLLVVILKPITKALDFISSALVKLLPKPPEGFDAPTVNEVMAMARFSEKAGHIDAVERTLMEKSGKFNDISSIDLMVPRSRVTAVPLTISYNDLLKVFRENLYTRVPVYKNNLDQIVGIFNFKELLKCTPNEMKHFVVKNHLMKPLYIPENVMVGELFERMRKTRTHMAIVIDEYSDTQGIVTMEDIQERVFGVINDEYDETQPEKVELKSGTMECEGDMSLQDLSDMLHIEFPAKARKRVNTLSGFLTDMKGNFLKENEKMYFGKYCFTINKMAGFRAESITITPRN